MKIVKLEILQSAQNDPKQTQTNSAPKVPYIYRPSDTEPQICARFALLSALFKILFHILIG